MPTLSLSNEVEIGSREHDPRRIDSLRSWLRQQIADNSYPGYVYGYPHKKAYRSLEPSIPLREIWHVEHREHLFCYVHIPFCNQRCSFCNLFTAIPSDSSPQTSYLDALRREMFAYADSLESFQFTQLYLGGGTPTFLTSRELVRLVGHLRDVLGIDPTRTNSCIECSPETLDEEKVHTLAELGFQRISLGVQSLVEEELIRVNRRFDFAMNHQAIATITKSGFPHFNIDLIYGLPSQTLASWRYSLERAVETAATSLFLYPLYIRPLTGLGVRQLSLDTFHSPTTHQMAEMYDFACERLAEAGFRQVTMRQFRRDLQTQNAGEYRCQEHGMIGLGAGARSYTTSLHYSTPWKMVARNIRGVIDDYIQRMIAGDTTVSHGFRLTDDERRRRLVIQSLLYEGLERTEFQQRFTLDPMILFAVEFTVLHDLGLITEEDKVRLTPRGRKHADIVGQLFFSTDVQKLIAEYEYDS